jgi:hypothetical protein
MQINDRTGRSFCARLAFAKLAKARGNRHMPHSACTEYRMAGAGLPSSGDWAGSDDGLGTDAQFNYPAA